MPFVGFHELFPEVAKRETRVLTVFPGASIALPPGEYSFIEMFCDEEGCDCRRAFFTVFSLPAKKTEALISWGWESAAFYKRWFRLDGKLSEDDKEMIEQMRGPILDFGSPISRNAEVLLQFFATTLLADTAYIERVKKHYAQFRAAIDSGEGPQGDRPQSESKARKKVGRNDPCPCGSGRKFKRCCLKVASLDG